ncbi:hypothetical protein CL619_01445 [archaeon]|nr:hypothetical protein [archaeon]|tara:strand:- start:4762 stop:6738 length:1977 start_codon:yes stop_codon:yes gene_type:complete
MKFFSILHKDFKLILRSKSSAFTVFIGPVLIIALILFAFSSSTDEINFSIGVVDISSTEASTQDFILELEIEGYTIIQFEELDSCISQMESSNVNLCLDFPKNETVIDVVDVENNETASSTKKQISFYVDQSRINVVESIIFTVGSNIEGKSEEMTEEKTKEIISEISTRISMIKSTQENSSEFVDVSLSEEISSTEDLSESIASDASSANNDLDTASDYGDTSEDEIGSIDTEYTALVADLDILMEIIDDLDLNGTDEDVYEDVEAQMDGSIATNINDLSDSIDSLNDEINSASSSTEDIGEDNAAILENINEIEEIISSLSSDLGVISDEVTTIAALTGQNIENEYEISINEIVSSSDKSLFMFPYYLVLLILFVGMMLGSTLVVIERQSMAFFRNYISPTGSFIHLASRFTANFLIIAMQVAIVLTAVYLYLKIPFLENYAVTLTILSLTIALFVFLGYLIGYIFKTQEGITIAMISFGSICAFLSNLILPVETFSSSIRGVLMYNPYMLASEVLKKAIVFNSSFIELNLEIITLSSYLLTVFLMVLVFQRISLTSFSFNLGKKRVLKRPHISQDKHFVLENGFVVEDISSMTEALKSMGADEYQEYGSGKNNEIALWISDVFKERILTWRIKRAKTKADVIKVLDTFLEKKKKK